VRGWVSPQQLERYGMLGMNARNLAFIQRYNERSRFPLVDDKLLTKLLAEEYGVPTPALRLVLRAQHQVQRVGRRLAALEGFAMKPAKGSGGKGIWVIQRRDEDAWVKASGARVGLADLQRHLSNTLAGLYSLGGNPDAVLVEDLISFNSNQPAGQTMTLADFDYIVTARDFSVFRPGKDNDGDGDIDADDDDVVDETVAELARVDSAAAPIEQAKTNTWINVALKIINFFR